MRGRQARSVTSDESLGAAIESGGEHHLDRLGMLDLEAAEEANRAAAELAVCLTHTTLVFEVASNPT